MPVAAERGILGRAAEKIQTLVRGYSQKDIDNLRRISSGEITDQDREQYINEQWYRCFFSPVAPPAGLEPSFVDPAGLMAAKEELERLRNLPEGQLNQEIRRNAELKAAKWGLKLTV